MPSSIVELDSLIDQKHCSINWATQVLDDSQYYQSTRARLQSNVDNLQRQLDELDAMREDGPAIIEQYRHEIEELKKKKKLIKHSNKIARLEKLHHELQSQAI